MTQKNLLNFPKKIAVLQIHRIKVERKKGCLKKEQFYRTLVQFCRRDYFLYVKNY